MYVQTQQIGDYQVVIGFRPPSIDPVASKAVVTPLLQETDEFKQLEQIQAKVIANLQLQGQIWRQWSQCLPESKEWTKYETDFRAVEAQYRVLKQQISHWGGLLEEQRRMLIESHGVRFGSRGVETVDQGTFDDLHKSFRRLDKRDRLLFDGTVIVDRVGVRYWIKDAQGTWSEHTIEKLGVEPPAESVLSDQLIESQKLEIADQKDLARIASLTPEEKSSEKEDLLEQALIKAGHKRGQYEIQKRLDPLGDAQKWYEDRCAEIENRYQ
jgi:hypothetical protein